MFSIEVPLKRVYDKQGEFHDKASVLALSSGDHILKSYGQRVCKITYDGRVFIGEAFPYTKTTCRHLKEFLKQHNIWNVSSQADIKKLPVVSLYF